MSTTKKNITDLVHLQTGIKKNDSQFIVNKFLEIIKNASKKQLSTKIAKFGTFKVKKTKKRIGRNPITKKEYIIESRKKVIFKPSNFIKNNMN
tara:strand:+ start:32885 stop:33163 length:279 start_codon:yes stop_codon:yes gene_type:complete